MKGVKELSIDGERVFVKKSKIFGWGFVHPYKIDGKLNWKNILIGGSWIKIGILALIILLIAGATNEYSNAVELGNACVSNSSCNTFIIN